MILVGGGSQLLGLKKFLKGKVNNSDIIIPTPINKITIKTAPAINNAFDAFSIIFSSFVLFNHKLKNIL